MKITLKRTPEQVELVKAMASLNRNVAYEAKVSLAEFIGPVLAEVMNNAQTKPETVEEVMALIEKIIKKLKLNN